jgi:hypothetical protein
MMNLASFGELVPIDVLTLQCGLWQLGFDAGRFDGLWGPMTAGALDRWYLWWRSRQVSAPEPVYEHPAPNRGGAVRIPEQWAELAAAAMRGPCSRQRRGAHREPPVPEPRPLAPPVVIVGPDGEPSIERPQPVQRGGAIKLPTWAWVVGGVLLVGGVVYAFKKDERAYMPEL